MYGRHREPALYVQEGGQAPRPARELRDRKPVSDVVPAGTPVFLGESPAQDPELPKPRQQLERKLGPVPVTRRTRDHLTVHELAYPVPDPLLLLREQTPHVHEIHGPPSPHSLHRNSHAPNSSLRP